VNTSQSLFNRKYQRGNPTGYAGVLEYNGRWRSRIMAYGKEVRLGCFDSLDEAIEARRLGEEKYFGEFGFFASRKHEINRNNLL
jgi:hypothetical protein